MHMLSKNNLSPTVVPLVSIWMLTYNHQDYIQQAIDSVMMQKTSFPYRLYIGEDCSTDNTRNICIKYAEKYPGKISLYLNKENNIVKNAQKIYDECFESGAKYIAMLEGDDYWTDPYKLQKQVDFLEAHPEYSMCFHKSAIIEGEEPKIREYFPTIDQNRTFVLNDFFQYNMACTASVVFRGKLLSPFPEMMLQTAFGDYALILHILKSGQAYFLNEVMSVYKIHAGGINAGTLATVDGQISNARKHLAFCELVKQEISESNKSEKFFEQESEYRMRLLLLCKKINSFDAYHKENLGMLQHKGVSWLCEFLLNYPRYFKHRVWSA